MALATGPTGSPRIASRDPFASAAYRGAVPGDRQRPGLHRPEASVLATRGRGGGLQPVLAEGREVDDEVEGAGKALGQLSA